MDKVVALNTAPVLGTFWLRDNLIQLLRVNQLTGNSEAAQYQLSDFERAIDLIYSQKFFEAQRLLSSFLQTHPHNKTALLEQYYLTQLTSGLASAQPMIDTLYRYYSADYTTCLAAAIYYKRIADNTGQASARTRSISYYEEALSRSGDQAENVRDMYNAYAPDDRVVK
jgi:hypothetical protein